jgi:aspartate-semialdehyde dehydrogenase
LAQLLRLRLLIPDEVVARANDTEYGLVAYLHSDDQRIYRVSRALQFGMDGGQSCPSLGAIPFGGTVGLGREVPAWAGRFTEIKYVCRDWA